MILVFVVDVDQFNVTLMSKRSLGGDIHNNCYSVIRDNVTHRHFLAQDVHYINGSYVKRVYILIWCVIGALEKKRLYDLAHIYLRYLKLFNLYCIYYKALINFSEYLI